MRRTNIYINPQPVALPLGGGYGYEGLFGGYGYGYGWSSFSLFAPGPSGAVGVGGGFDTLILFLALGTIVVDVRRFINRNYY
jgi:CubicO group peptidase (beta-lactamase class C family)